MSLLLGLFDRPADAGCLKALWKVPAIPDLTEPLVGTSEAHRNLAFTRLQDAKLLRDTAGAHLAPCAPQAAVLRLWNRTIVTEGE